MTDRQTDRRKRRKYIWMIRVMLHSLIELNPQIPNILIIGNNIDSPISQAWVNYCDGISNQLHFAKFLIAKLP